MRTTVFDLQKLKGEGRRFAMLTAYDYSSALIAEAAFLVHLSDAEGQSLAVLEALALHTPCLLSALPQQREMAARWPDAITLVEDDGDLAARLRQPLRQIPPGSIQVPTWDDVAGELLGLYAGLDEAPRVWSARG